MQINTHGRLPQYETKWPHYRIKVVPSKYLSPLQNQDLIDLKKNGLMEMILLQNQEPAFYIWHLSTKSKTHTWWGNRCFRGPILYRIKVIPSHHPSPVQNQDLKVWHWWACSDYKIKDLRTSPALFLQNQFLTQNVRFCALPAECWGPCLYMSTESGTYQDTVQKWSKLVVLGWLPAHGPWFCSTVGFQTGSPESKVFGVPTPSIL